jgi:hypothetical protein
MGHRPVAVHDAKEAVSNDPVVGIVGRPLGGNHKHRFQLEQCRLKRLQMLQPEDEPLLEHSAVNDSMWR